ncbi:hypothetical protein ACQ859_10970 [Roseateles chitinivorans]|uniref:hypothetical protein n=1 Tax=Roseateles chitinivorans TaxID=2917965 RepID=UPI003D67D630
MSQDRTSSAGSVRLLFEISRDDNPRLYDDLVRFNKGIKRVNRLRFLAHEGLMAQHRAAEREDAAAAVAPRAVADLRVSAAVARQTNLVFDAPSAIEAEQKERSGEDGGGGEGD